MTGCDAEIKYLDSVTNCLLKSLAGEVIKKENTHILIVNFALSLFCTAIHYVQIQHL